MKSKIRKLNDLNDRLDQEVKKYQEEVAALRLERELSLR